MKIALVTGSTRGIGHGIAEALCKEGYKVILSGTRDIEDMPDLIPAMEAQGCSVDYFKCNIGEEADRKSVFAYIEKTYGRLDLLVNNAGVAPTVRLDVLSTTPESVERLLRINLEGTFFMCQEGANLMLRTKAEGETPRIVNISSMSAYTSSVNRGEYCMSKAGIAMVTKLFADRLAEEGIPVFEVRPGIIQTDMTAGVKEKYDRLIAEGVTPIKRMGQPADVAGCVVACAKGYLDFGTGTVLNADGGFHIQRL